MRTLANDITLWKFNYQSIKNALRELEIDFYDGPKEFVMHCWQCETEKPTLYVNHLLKPGLYHCFRCHSKGHFDQFIANVTGWGPLHVIGFLRKHRACPVDPDDMPERREGKAVTKEYLAEFSYRHAYLYDRGFTETTLRRYRIGYDPAENDIIIPWYDRVGGLIAIKRRSVLDKHYRFETDKNVAAHLFGLSFVRPRSIVWIVEAEFDAMWLDQCFRQMHSTLHYATGLGGKYLSKLAYEQLLVKEPAFIVIATDNDDAGSDAAKAINSQITGISRTILTYPVGVKDPNELTFEQVVSATAHIGATHAQSEQRKKERHNAWTQSHSDLP